MTCHPLLLLLTACILLQINDDSIIVPALSSPAGVEASIQVKLLEQKLPGAVFSILLKFKSTSEVVLSEFRLDEKHCPEWELLSAGSASKTQTEGKAIQTIPFILRAKKTGDITIPDLKAFILLDAKDITLAWNNWLFPDRLFPFKELDTPKETNGPIIDRNSPWLAIGLLVLIAIGVLGLIKKTPAIDPSELDVAKELETWLKKVNAITLKESITTLEPILRAAIRKQANAIASQEMEPPISNEQNPSQRLLLESALQAIEEIKYSKNKDRVTLISTVHKLAKYL